VDGQDSSHFSPFGKKPILSNYFLSGLTDPGLLRLANISTLSILNHLICWLEYLPCFAGASSLWIGRATEYTSSNHATWHKDYDELEAFEKKQIIIKALFLPPFA
jgi:hypothetical protein